MTIGWKKTLEEHGGEIPMTEQEIQFHSKRLINRTKIINDINNERNRQDLLHPKKLPLAMRFVTIMEEAGEVAEALQEKDNDSIYRELIDTAASCVRMAEEVMEAAR